MILRGITFSPDREGSLLFSPARKEAKDPPRFHLGLRLRGWGRFCGGYERRRPLSRGESDPSTAAKVVLIRTEFLCGVPFCEYVTDVSAPAPAGAKPLGLILISVWRGCLKIFAALCPVRQSAMLHESAM